MAESSPPEPSSTTRSKGRATTSNSSVLAKNESAARRKVHFVLQGKGGVGKTLIASLLAQFYLKKGGPLVCLDTDPVNGSFSAIREIDASHIKLLDGDRIKSMSSTRSSNG